MNSTQLIGRLVKAPEVRYTEKQLAVARFTLAINRPPRDGQERGADFINIVVFGKQAENCERYLDKGRKVAIQGHIQTGSYEKDGRKVYTTDVIADRVEFLEWGNSSDAPQGDIPQEWQEVGDEDVPF